MDSPHLKRFLTFFERFRRRLRICPRADERSQTKTIETMKNTSQFLTFGATLLLAPFTSTFAQSTWQQTSMSSSSARPALA